MLSNNSYLFPVSLSLATRLSMSIMDKYLNHVSITNDSLMLNQSKTFVDLKMFATTILEISIEIKNLHHDLIKRKREIVV